MRQMTFRWFGADDPVTLEHVRQVPGVEGIVSALHHVPPGEVPAGAVWEALARGETEIQGGGR